MGRAPRNGAPAGAGRSGSRDGNRPTRNSSERGGRNDRPARDNSSPKRPDDRPGAPRPLKDGGTMRAGVLHEERHEEPRRSGGSPGFKKPGNGFGKSKSPSRNPASRRK
jgi:hypothetical protein